MLHHGARTRTPSAFAVGVAAALTLALAGLHTRPAAAAQAMWFENLSLDQGLSQSTVFAILQDSEGFMWFGTENGLNRYDGYGFKRYERNPHSADALHDDFIWAAVEDQNGDLWFGTDGDGLSRWARSRDRFTAFRHDDADPTTISANAVRALARDARGRLWVGTIGSGVDQLDPATGKVIARYRSDASNPDSLSNDEVYVLRVDEAGRVWIGTNGGLNHLDPATGSVKRWTFDAADPASLSDNRVRAIFQDSDGVVWVGTNKGGLDRLR